MEDSIRQLVNEFGECAHGGVGLLVEYRVSTFGNDVHSHSQDLLARLHPCTAECAECSERSTPTLLTAPTVHAETALVRGRRRGRRVGRVGWVGRGGWGRWGRRVSWCRRSRFGRQSAGGVWGRPRALARVERLFEEGATTRLQTLHQCVHRRYRRDLYSQYVQTF